MVPKRFFTFGNHGVLVVRSRFRGRRVPGSKPDSTEDPSCMWACCVINHTQGVKRTSRWRGAEDLRRGMPAQMSSSSSNGGSKCEVGPKIALELLQKQVVNIIKLQTRGGTKS
ncbi:hypothetical protein AVEN_85446-1 [Araneus ventricosus]|uniref:Uncharacterized protein n=1 Tax=Araneus ventricosus TaxID=182803 RepID=A0A4Y2GXG4_ARAVE|nr:hypothetical protein AVEN_85446-1 [Araneus ventricosus]